MHMMLVVCFIYYYIMVCMTFGGFLCFPEQYLFSCIWSVILLSTIKYNFYFMPIN
jgi:hypothetical protein